MAHPFAAHREHKVQKSRVASITKGYAQGGAVLPGGGTGTAPSAPKRATGGPVSVEGSKPSVRLDKFARGGKVKKGATNVNVIIAPQGGGMPVPAPGLPPPALGPASPPPMLPPGIGPGGPPMMPQRRGGRAYASGGSVKEEGMRNGTQVQHTDGKNDGGDIYRGKQITYAKGGAAYPIEDGAGGGLGRLEKIGKRGR